MAQTSTKKRMEQVDRFVRAVQVTKKNSLYPQKQPNKRRKVNKTRATFVNDLGPHLSFDPLLNQLESQNESSFERFIEGVLPEYVKERDSILEREVEQGTDVSFAFTNNRCRTHNDVGRLS